MRILIFLLLFPAGLFSQSIPNGSFESWHVPGNYENPVSWDTPNDITSAISVYPVLKESNMVKQGVYSAHLETRQVFASVVPGLVCLGDFSVNILTSQITLGAGPAFTYKPSHFRGWYIYDPKSGDECYIAAFLLKKNGSIYDTLARAEFQTTQQNLTWKEFNIPFQYSSTETPTHVNVIALSSYFFTTPQVNSALYVDDFRFEYNSSEISSVLPEGFNINTHSGQIQIPEGYGSAIQLRLVDITGKLLAFVQHADNNYTFYEIAGLNQGIYLLEIMTDNEHFVYKFNK